MQKFSENINIIEQNLLDANVQSIASCLNCFRIRRSGIIKQICEAYPLVGMKDSLTSYGDLLKLGTIEAVRCTRNSNLFYIFNCYGQYNLGTEKRQVNYESIYTCLEKVREFMEKNNLTSIGFPYNICCGLAGGSWEIVSAMIEAVFGGTEIQVEICKLPK